MEHVALDVLGPFPATDQGNLYILVAMDYFINGPEMYAFPNHRDRLAPYRLFACPDRGTETDTLLPTPVLLPQATKAPQGNSWFLST